MVYVLGNKDYAFGGESKSKKELAKERGVAVYTGEVEDAKNKLNKDKHGCLVPRQMPFFKNKEIVDIYCSLNYCVAISEN